MRINCANCKKVFTLPDEKLPADGSPVKLKCPHCKTSMSARAPAVSTSASAGGVNIAPGSRVALMATRAKNIESIVRRLGFTPIGARSADEAIKKLQYTPCALVALDENFDSSSLESNKLYQFIINLGTDARRKMFLALISERAPSRDPMAAFAKSANMIVNERDLKSFESLLRGELGERSILYTLMSQTLVETGRENEPIA